MTDLTCSDLFHILVFKEILTGLDMLNKVKYWKNFRRVIVENLMSRNKLSSDCLYDFLGNESSIECTYRVKYTVSLESKRVEEV
jgi:hypothetical protein